MSSQNHITVAGDGTIIIQDADAGEISMNVRDADDILGKLYHLNDAQLDALAQVAEKRPKKSANFLARCSRT